MHKIDFKNIPALIIILYVPFHLSEEALGNFPSWMALHYHLPKPLSYPHWLINNSLFLITLLIALFIYYRNTTKFRFLGLGILIWALMNSFEHIVFSLLDLKISPGLFTGLLFLFVSIAGIYKVYSEKQLNSRLLLKSIVSALVFWAFPMSLIIVIGNFLIKIFP